MPTAILSRTVQQLDHLVRNQNQLCCPSRKTAQSPEVVLYAQACNSAFAKTNLGQTVLLWADCCH